jgi:hypothetical protein
VREIEQRAVAVGVDPAVQVVAGGEIAARIRLPFVVRPWISTFDRRVGNRPPALARNSKSAVVLLQ